MSLKIISSKSIGQKQVYNLTMKSKHHNYLLDNKIVSGNSHAVAYSFISYRTAWLKAYYPAEFYTALLNSSLNDQDDLVKYIHSARELEIPLLPPDINRSGSRFTLDNGTIIFGLAGIKGVGEKACEQLISTRPEDGFKELQDLINAKVKKNIIVALAECGALEDISNLRRWQIVEHIEKLIEYSGKLDKWEEQREKREIRNKEIEAALAEGKRPPRRLPKLKDKPELEEITPGEPLSREERLKLERKTLGFYLTGHPLADYPKLLAMSQCTINQIKEGNNITDGQVVRFPAVISNCSRRRSRAKQEYAILTVEDITGRIEATIFSKTWERLHNDVKEGEITIVTGRIGVKLQDDAPPVINIIVKNISKPSLQSEAIDKISVTLKDSSTVTFIPKQDCSYSKLVSALSYAANMKKMT